jgi:glutathione peroxidase
MKKILLGCATLVALLGATFAGARAASDGPGAHAFSFTSLAGDPLKLADFRGKTLLVVNTASKCGFVGQLDGLEQLWQKYRDRGLVVIGVPSNDFGSQEPLEGEAIADFCRLNYGVSFPLTAKTVVSGDEAHPFYQWAGQQAGVMGRPRWNFHKYLIGPEGQLLDWFAPTTKPDDEKILTAIEKSLQLRPKSEQTN